MGNNLEIKKMMCWKEVERVIKGEQARDKMVKDVNGQILCDGEDSEEEIGRVF